MCAEFPERPEPLPHLPENPGQLLAASGPRQPRRLEVQRTQTLPCADTAHRAASAAPLWLKPFRHFCGLRLERRASGDAPVSERAVCPAGDA